MQAIPMDTARRRAISGGALLVFGGGLALYQMTSLVLGPDGDSRQLRLAISAPSVDLIDLSEPVISNVNLVLGTLARPAAPPASPSAASHRDGVRAPLVSKASPPAAAPIVAPTAEPVAPTSRPATKPLPPGVKPLPSGIRIVSIPGD
jgi:hypothetical protein